MCVVRLVTFNKPGEALVKYFKHFSLNLKVGLVNAITGSPFLKSGTGKSYTGLVLGEQLDPDFHIGKVVFYPKTFLQVMDDIENNTSQRSGTTKPSQVCNVDEGEFVAEAKLWFTFTNRAVSYNLATFRYLRCFANFIIPAFSWIDKRIRILTSHWGYCEKTLGKSGRGDQVVYLRLYRITTDLFGDKIYLRKIKMYSKPKERTVIFKRFKVGLPSEDLREAYEKKHIEFKRDRRKKLLAEVKKWEKYNRLHGMRRTKKELERIATVILDNEEIRDQLFIGDRLSTSDVQYGLSSLDPEKYKIGNLDLTEREARMIAKIIKHRWKK